MERVLQNTAATIKATFYVDGTATDPSPDTATVTITRADGTAVVTNSSATNLGVGVFGFTLSAAQTALLDRLTARWTATVGGVAQTLTTTVEVAGAYLFSIPDARSISPLNDTVKYTTARLVAMRTVVESALEDEAGRAFVPRYEYERIVGSYGYSGYLPRAKWPMIRAVRSATVNGTVVDPTGLASFVPAGAAFYYPAGWGVTALADVTLGYEHGMDRPPPRVSQAAVLLAKRWLIDGPADDRATSMSTADGTFSLVTPGMRGAMFDIPEVNAVVDQYARVMAT